MNPEPSLLDYLKSLLDPRRERIRLPDDTGADGETPRLRAFAEDTPPASRAFPPVPRSEAPPAAPASPFPWRTFAMLLLALFAQGIFEPPDRSASTGTVVYLLALAVGLRALFAGEFALAPLPQTDYEQDDSSGNPTRLAAALAIGGLAFLALGGNRFTPFNLALWLAAIGLAVHALRPAARAPLGRRLASAARALWSAAASPWGMAVLLGFAVTLFFRFHRLDQVPPQMFSDHAEKLQDVQDVLNGETRIFFPRNTGREFVQMYLTAFTAKYLDLGLTFMALKMGTALAGIVTLPFIYLLGAELANRRVGLIGMTLAGISYWLNVITRVALRFSLYPLFAAPVLYHVVRGLRRGRRADFIQAGLWLGLGLHGYSPFRFVPILAALAVGLFVLHAGSAARRRQAVWHLGIVVVLSLLVFLPLLRYMTESPENRANVLYRGLTRISTLETEFPAPPGRIFVENLGRAMAMFAWSNGDTWVHSVVNRPAVDVVSGALFYPGCAFLLVRYLRRRHWEDAFLLVSVPFLMLPSIMSLAFPNENPSLNRTGGAIIPVFIIAALMLDAVMRALHGWGGSRWGRAASWGVAGFLLCWSGWNNYDLIFRQYYEQFRLSAWNTTELGGVIRGFINSVGTEETAWVIPWPHWVDTRLVGINAGVYIKDYAIPRERLPETVQFPGPKLFLFNTQDSDTLAALMELYPGGTLQTYLSEVPGKDFLMYLVLDSSVRLTQPERAPAEPYPAPPASPYP
jgi:hypothetical protein